MSSTPGTGTRPPRVVLVAVALVALAAGLAGGMLLASGLLTSSTPPEGSAEAGFARDMDAHHDQAVQMATLVRDRSQDETIRSLALDMVLTQRQQQGQMFGWLASWGLPPASTEIMAWMGDHHSVQGLSQMPGMATPEQLDALRQAEAVEAERIFLALMIPHHEGGVEMAEAVLELSERPEVRRLASSIVEGQTAEIDVLRMLLDERGGPPEGL
ncbi:DUF305 domain-containing protein [Cellulomonas bogoriensis]|uniref:DUF305 domain-containing protein n=1 Tax=Cellulomonas bogoriensis 69B4 = DSM 16987 TaxID=1386082 RepID=A0A0A0BYC2_9CELL|nr:DUF305 domain-containing protein [Cellulomonas bogoriensis]KGM13393.1 hypothetical protein N869_14290 [Cellulomonas bogoriensis 69B4 = DSM 16987]